MSTVLFIGGLGRSGSTLLCHLLDQTGMGTSASGRTATSSTTGSAAR